MKQIPRAWLVGAMAAASPFGVARCTPRSEPIAPDHWPDASARDAARDSSSDAAKDSSSDAETDSPLDAGEDSSRESRDSSADGGPKCRRVGKLSSPATNVAVVTLPDERVLFI